MACFKRFKRSQVGHIVSHSLRKSTPLDGHVTSEKSCYNDTYVARDVDYLERRLEELGCSRRADVNVFAELIVTKPKTFRGTSKDFFDSVYEFAKLNYKENNIVYSVVHRDEPHAEDHIHIGFVPTVYDRKKKKAVVSYDKCVHRQLDKFHPKLSEYLNNIYGYDVGVLNGATRNGNKSIEQLKQERALREDISALQIEREKILAQRESDMCVDDKIIIARYKQENEQLKAQNSFLIRFIQENKLYRLFKQWRDRLKCNKIDKKIDKIL